MFSNYLDPVKCIEKLVTKAEVSILYNISYWHSFSSFDVEYLMIEYHTYNNKAAAPTNIAPIPAAAEPYSLPAAFLCEEVEVPFLAAEAEEAEEEAEEAALEAEAEMEEAAEEAAEETEEALEEASEEAEEASEEAAEDAEEAEEEAADEEETEAEEAEETEEEASEASEETEEAAEEEAEEAAEEAAAEAALSSKNGETFGKILLEYHGNLVIASVT